MTDTKHHSVQPPPNRTRRRRWWVVVIGLAIIVAIGAAGVFYFFSGDAPPEVDLAATAAALSETGDDSAPSITASNGAVGINGLWGVDTTIGTFTIDDNPTATFAGFRVDEELSTLGSNTAVGRTPDVIGTIEIEANTLVSAEIIVNMTTIVSDQSRRENSIQDALNTDSHPTATFVLGQPLPLSDGAASAEIVTATITGDLTINGATKTVDMAFEAQLIDGAILATGSTGIVFADFDITVPSARIVLSVEDHGILEMQLWLTPAP